MLFVGKYFSKALNFSFRFALLFLSVLINSACQTTKPDPSVPQLKTAAPAPPKFMVSSANPLAAQAGRQILLSGGNAIDAAIATQMVLTLVEPQSSGIGGGAFLMYFDSKTGSIESYDGRETAPSTASPDMFLNSEGKPLDFFKVVVGGLSVGTPGLLRMLENVHKKHGKLPWRQLFESAIVLAREGFIVSNRLANLIAKDRFLTKFPETKKYFYRATGKPRAKGERLKNPLLANTLEKISIEGADYFYKGELASEIAKKVSANSGRLSVSDLNNYKAKKRPPVCLPYRKWLVCGMGPPSSGGITTLQILGMLQRFNLANLGAASVRALHLISEASALAFADRNTYIADSDFIPVPVGGMLDPSYLQRRANQIPVFTAGGKRYPGMPGPVANLDLAPSLPSKGTSTSHISIVDSDGNSISMTSSIENAFGSRLMVGGFLLNNQLTDFSFMPTRNGAPVANKIAPGKRPRSSMAPTLVFDGSGKLVMVIGTPGGSRIIGYVVKTIIAVLDWKFPINKAINLPNFTNRNGGIELERGTQLETLKIKLEAMGHQVKLVKQNSGLQGIFIENEILEGGSDSRREGVFVTNQ